MISVVRSFSLLFFALISLSLSSPSFAQTSEMDRQSYDDLIAKLEMLVASGTSDVPGSNATLIRLADVYAERARIFDLEAGKNNCTDCKDARKDRLAAIRVYQRALRAADATQRNRIHFQLAQLNSALNKHSDASRWYQEVLKSGDPMAKSLAHLGLGDIEFMKPSFQKASEHYKESLLNARPQDRAYLNYRLAWCALNEGNNPEALALIKKAIAEADANSQQSFRRDIVRDYATILGRNDFKEKDIESFIAASVPEDRHANLKALGEEAERLGNKQGALVIWTKYSQAEGKNNGATADSSLRIAMSLFDLNQRNQTLQNLKITSDRMKKMQCEDCPGVRVNFKNFLVSWNKREKVMPSADLVKAYSLYIDANPDEFEVQIWAAQAAELRKARKDAAQLYLTAGMTAERKHDRITSDQTMMLAIEQAELSGDQKLREDLLRKYLEVHPKGHEAHLVRYQLTLIEYKRGKHELAAQDFRTLATQDSWKDQDLRIKSAELALDALAQLKDESAILSWSQDFARRFPRHSVRFNEIHRKTAVNHLASGIQQKASDSDIRRRLAIVAAAPLDGASASDRRLILKNLLTTGERLKDLEIVERAARALLQEKGLSRGDEELALASLLWIQELRLDFGSAYRTASLMSFPQLKKDQRHLKLGLLAELAGQNPQRHYRDFLSNTQSSRQANEVRVRLIRRAKSQWKEFDLHSKKLVSTPDLLSSIALEIHLNQPNNNRLAELARIPKIGNTPDGKRIVRIYSLQRAQSVFAEIRKMRISSGSPAALKRSIQVRIRKLDQVKGLFDKALEDGYLTLQANALGTIARENSRFADEIKQLPSPKDLSKSERELYRNMILDEAKPFEVAAREANALLEDFMDKNSGAIDELSKAVLTGSITDRLYAKFEYLGLRRLMSKRQVGKVEGALAKIKVSGSELESAKRKVRQNPLDTSPLEDLRELVARQGNGPLIAFLDVRLAQLQTEGRR